MAKKKQEDPVNPAAPPEGRSTSSVPRRESPRAPRQAADDQRKPQSTFPASSGERVLDAPDRVPTITGSNTPSPKPKAGTHLQATGSIRLRLDEPKGLEQASAALNSSVARSVTSVGRKSIVAGVSVFGILVVLWMVSGDAAEQPPAAAVLGDEKSASKAATHTSEPTRPIDTQPDESPSSERSSEQAIVPQKVNASAPPLKDKRGKLGKSLATRSKRRETDHRHDSRPKAPMLPSPSQFTPSVADAEHIKGARAALKALQAQTMTTARRTPNAEERALDGASTPEPAKRRIPEAEVLPASEPPPIPEVSEVPDLRQHDAGSK